MSNKLRNAGQAIGASVVVSLIALIGLLMLVPLLFNKKVISLNSQGAVMQVAQLFASGALLATAFMFIFPETLNAFRLAYTGDSDAQQAARAASLSVGRMLAVAQWLARSGRRGRAARWKTSHAKKSRALRRGCGIRKVEV